MVLGVKVPLDAVVVIFSPLKTGLRRKTITHLRFWSWKGKKQAKQGFCNVMDVKNPSDAVVVCFSLKTGLRRKFHHKISFLKSRDKQGVCLTVLRLAVVSWMPLFVFLFLRGV